MIRSPRGLDLEKRGEILLAIIIIQVSWKYCYPPIFKSLLKSVASFAHSKKDQLSSNGL